MSKRFKIAEAQNGFILEVEWDCDEGGTDSTVHVFSGEEMTALKNTFDYIKGIYE